MRFGETMRLVFSGSFDPITNGHLDIIKRGAAICDELIVCAFINNKKIYKYPEDVRKKMLEAAVGDIPNVRVDMSSGLLADYCRRMNADAVIRGIRSVKDYEYEQEMALLNYRRLGIDTIFMVSSPELSYISSSSIKEMLEYDVDVKGLVPDSIIDLL